MRAALQNNFDPTRWRIAERWLKLLMLCLLGYALLGRGFAYIGLPPLYIGEMCLAIGIFALLLARGWSRIFQVPAAVALIPLMLLGFFRMLPGVQTYRIDAIRDAVVWGYALFAIIFASVIVADAWRVPRLVESYRRFTKIFLVGIPIAFFVYRFAHDALPRWPGADTPIIGVKEGDVLVHLAGILAFWMADPRRNVGWFWAIMLTLDMALMGVIDRAGLVSFGAVMIICVIFKPRHGAVWRTVAMLLCGVVLLWASEISVPVPGGKGRDISWEQFVTNFKSIFSSSRGTLEGNKEWRLDWWKEIVHYTVYGDYFWTGKGFGINLADDDGFQVQSDKSLRSPHSVHMTMLARMGVPGIVAWGTVLLAFSYGMADGYVRARRRNHQRWAGLFLFLFCYFAAFAINGSFDVFIEGPMGGIWFWSIFGTGVGAVWVWRYAPYVLADEDDEGAQFASVDESSGRAQLLPATGRGGRRLPLGAGAA
jgi:hypothetical protein